jgi:hypothetical protein
MRNLQRGPRVFAPGTLIRKLRLQWGPCRVKTAAVAFDRRVLTSGEGLAEGKWVLHDPQDMLFLLVGDVHQEKRWSMAGGEEWRLPWRRAHVPGEGSVNVDGWGAHEHRGGVGVRLRYLIWPEVGRKGVVDVEAARVPLAAEAARLPSIPAKEKSRLGHGGSRGK